MFKSDLEDSSSSETNCPTKGPMKKPTRWQRTKNNMSKWWWAYLVVFGCIVLVVILPLAYVGLPRFADDYINNHQFDYDGLAITNPRPSSFHVSLSKKFSMGGGLSGSGHLTAFNASFRVPSTNEEITEFPLPQIDFNNNGGNFNIDQDVNLSCVQCVSRMLVAAATNQSVEMLITGNTDLKLGGLPTAHLDIHKTMSMKGYNFTDIMSSQGAFDVTSLNLMKPPVDGFNFNATIALSNPTPFVVEMGHVVFNLSMGGSKLGYLDIPNLMLRQDNTSTVVLGNVDESMLAREFVWGDENSSDVTIHFKGHSCDYNGVEIPYFAAAIKAIDASATFDLLQFVNILG